MHSAYKLNKQGDNIHPWWTPFLIWNQSVVPCPVLPDVSWSAYRFLRRQVRWSGIPISVRIFHSLLWSITDSCLENSMDVEAWQATVHGGDTTEQQTLSLYLMEESLLSSVRVVSPAYLRLFLLAFLIPVCESSSPAFCMRNSEYKLNKQGKISSLSQSIVFLYFSALITEEGFLIFPFLLCL